MDIGRSWKKAGGFTMKRSKTVPVFSVRFLDQSNEPRQWKLACVTCSAHLTVGEQQEFGRRLAVGLHEAKVFIDNTILFTAAHSILGGAMAHTFSPGSFIYDPLIEAGYQNPEKAAMCVSGYVDCQSHGNTILVIADPITMQFVDLFLGQSLGSATQFLFPTMRSACLVTVEPEGKSLRVTEVDMDLLLPTIRKTYTPTELSATLANLRKPNDTR